MILDSRILDFRLPIFDCRFLIAGKLCEQPNSTGRAPQSKIQNLKSKIRESKISNLIIPLTTAFLVGCAGPQEYFPLKLGRSNSYSVRTGFNNYVESITPQRVVSVAGVRGFELDSALGTSTVGWKGDTLVGERLANAQVIPAVPLLSPTQLDKKLPPWNGTLAFPGGKEEATGTLTQSKTSLSIGGRKFDTIKTVLVIDTDKRQIELETYYAQGIGPVKQEQRTNGHFDLAMELLAEK